MMYFFTDCKRGFRLVRHGKQKTCRPITKRRYCFDYQYHQRDLHIAIVITLGKQIGWLILCMISGCQHGYRRVKRGRSFLCVKITPHKCKPGYRMVKKGRRLVCQKPVPNGHHKCHKGEHLIRRGRKYLCVKTQIRCKRFFRAVMIGKKQICKPVKRCPKGYLMIRRGKRKTCKRVTPKPHPHPHKPTSELNMTFPFSFSIELKMQNQDNFLYFIVLKYPYQLLLNFRKMQSRLSNSASWKKHFLYS